MRLLISSFRPSPGIAMLALSLATARAAVVPDPVSGDVYLAFRAAGGTGGSSSYIVKLGQDTVFRGASAGSSFQVSGLGDIGADLTALYGANWNTRADLFLGVFGVRPSTSSILYASRARVPSSVASLSWPALDLIARNTTASQITSVLESINGYKGRESTVNSTVAAIQPNADSSSSYHKQVATAGTNDFGSLSEWTSIEADLGAGASSTALDLYRIAGSGVTRVGRFSISPAGIVTFSAPPPVDTDGDGYPDSQETLAGTNPADPADFFKVLTIGQAPGSVGVSFHGIPSRTYRIFYTGNLVAEPWTEIGVISGLSASGTQQFQDTDPVRTARPAGFYRVSVTQ